MGSALPYRLDLFDDEIESSRPSTSIPSARSIRCRKSACCRRANFRSTTRGARSFRQRFRETFEGDPSRIGDLQGRLQRHRPRRHRVLPAAVLRRNGDAVRLPAARTRCSCLHGDVAGGHRRLLARPQRPLQHAQGDRARPLLPPARTVPRRGAFFVRCKPSPAVNLSGSDRWRDRATLPLRRCGRRPQGRRPAGARCSAFCAGFDGRVLLLAESAGRRETWRTTSREYGLKPAACADFAGLLAGTAPLALASRRSPPASCWPQGRLAFITETELYAATARTPRQAPKRAAASLEGWLRDLSELQGRRPGGA